MNASDLMTNSRFIAVPDPSRPLLGKRMLFFRADEVIKILQDHNAHLQDISDRLKKAAEKAKVKLALIDEAERIIRSSECRCRYIGDGETIDCYRCLWLEDLKASREKPT